MTDSSRGYQQFFAELKRRHVFKVAAIYGAVAFGVLQVAEPLGTALGLSDSFLSLVVGLLLVGFPVALVLAWAFEVTPEGVQKAEPAAPGEIAEIIAQPASKRWPAGLLALAGAGLLFGGWWMGQRTGSGPELNLAVSDAMAAEFSRIAVLPFEDLGGNEENDPFLSGMHVDIHEKLMGLADLRVTALGSVRDYGASEKSTAEIANELSVDYLLRGSVRRVGDQARVNVQLTDVAIGEDIWFDAFDEEVTPENVFQIQSRIARAVADQLEAELSPADEARIEAGPPTDDLAALNWYNLARLAALDVSKGGTLPEALDYAKRAVELDPSFVDAWALQANLLSKFVIRGEPVADEARAAVERTAALAPGSVAALKSSALYEVFVARNFVQTLELAERARELAPSDAEVVEAIGLAQLGNGNWEEAALSFRQAVALDPKNPVRLQALAEALREQGMLAAADRVVERMLQVDPSDTYARTMKVHLTVSLGRGLEQARSLATELRLGTDVWEEAERLAWLEASAGNWEEAEKILATIPSDTLYLEEVNRLYGRGWFRHRAGGDPSAFGDSLLALKGRTYAGESILVEAAGHLMTGESDRGWQLVDQAVREADRSDDAPFANNVRSVAAHVSTSFGRYDRALELFERIIDVPGFSIPEYHWLRLNAVYDPLRSDPRFDAILEKRRRFEDEAARRAEELGPWLP